MIQAIQQYFSNAILQDLFWVYFFMASLYFVVTASVAKALVDRPGLRTFSSFFILVLFAGLTLFFVVRAVLLEFWSARDLEFTLVLFGFLPAGLFIHLRKEHSMLGRERDLKQMSRFDKLKDEFVTVASHELRTPLSVINGFAEVLVREKLGPLNDEQKRRIRKILIQAQRLNRIIDELLDLSRIRSGKIELRKTVFDLVPVLKSALDDQQIICEQQRIQLIDNVPDILPDVCGDLERVTQVIVNLLGNAVKYTPGGRSVTLSAHYERQKNMVRIDVQDTGIGIAPENQQYVFEEFYRVTQKQNTHKYPGSGLGLSIVKQLVEAMHGEVGLSSEGVDKGSTFYFLLPVVEKKGITQAEEIRRFEMESQAVQKSAESSKTPFHKAS